MKSFKTTPKLQPHINYIKNQQSDIFIQKGLNKPEIKYGHKKLINRNTFKSSYNFLEWDSISPHLSPSIKIKQNPNNISQILNSNTSEYLKYNFKKFPQKQHRPFYVKMFEDDLNDQNPNKSEYHINARYQRETMDLGNYEGNEYKIKKNKSVVYDPSPYYKNKNPLKQKMDLIYGGCDDIIGNYKPAINRNKKFERSSSSIGFAKRDFQTRNEYDPKIRDNPKKMKYFLIYGNKGIENANKKLKPLRISRSTNNMYIPGEHPFTNRVNFFKSNIFNDKDVERINNNNLNDDIDDNNLENNNTIKVNRKIKPKRLKTKSANLFSIKNLNDINLNDIDINDNQHSKKAFYKHNDEKLPTKLDWNDPKLYLLFPQNKNEDILKKNARQRKFKNVYGTDPILPKKKIGQEFTSDERHQIDQDTQNNYQNINYSKMKRISDNIAQMQGNQYISKNNKNIRNKNNDIKQNKEGALTYEIKSKSKKNRSLLSNHDIEKQFADEGIHIFDLREDMGSIFHNNNDNKIEFKIRENNKDNSFDKKMTKIKEEFKGKGFELNEKINKKKENNELIPQTLKWNNPFCGHLTKNKIAVKTNEGRTHSKPPLNRKNEEEKITRIFVNLKYKPRPYNA